jgi:hypothetical protein
MKHIKTFERFNNLNEGLGFHTKDVLGDIFKSNFEGTFYLGNSGIEDTKNGTVLRIYDLEPFDDITAKKLGYLIYNSGIYINPNTYTFNEENNTVTYYFD